MISTLQEGLAPNAVQSFGHNADGGLFTISYGSQVTEPLPADASVDAIAEALMKLGGIRNVEVVGAGTLDDPWVITIHDGVLTGTGEIKDLVFNVADVYLGSPVNAIDTVFGNAVDGIREVQRVVVDATGGNFTLTYASTPTSTVTEQAAGSTTTKETQRLTLSGTGTGSAGAFKLLTENGETANIAWSDTPATLAGNIAAALNAGGIYAGDVTVTSLGGGAYDIAFQTNGAHRALEVNVGTLTGA
ncbi:MAG: hypothetical protein Q7V62_13780, partial [Actinomycetota bacterium]|nr:hypothetical protein [Actinomycetota bacterium]